MSSSTIDAADRPLSPTPSGGTLVADTDDSRHPPEMPDRQTSFRRVCKSPFFYRIIAFILLEAGFVSLAFCATRNPILIALPTSGPFDPETETRGLVTALSIFWHSLAVFMVKDIVLQVFSAEWMEMIHKKGKMVPRKTDIVSQLTSGYLEQISHFSSNGSSKAFRSGFGCMLLFLILTGIGPSALSITSISLPYPYLTGNRTFTVANLTWLGTSQDPSNATARRSSLITRLELFEQTPYGFNSTANNVLIPWPSLDIYRENTPIIYHTDIVSYDFDCTWEMPSLVQQNSSGWVWSFHNKSWVVDSGVDASSSNLGEVLLKKEILLAKALKQSDVLAGSFDSPFAYIFIGYNGTNSTNYLNLTSHPTIPIRANINQSSNPLSSLPTKETTDIVATALNCDVTYWMNSTNVAHSDGQLTADMELNLTAVNNIPALAVNSIFSHSMEMFVQSLSAPGANDLSAETDNIARFLFFTDPSLTPGPGGIKPLAIDEIQQNIHRAVQSSAKVYLSGVHPKGINAFLTEMDSFNINGSVYSDTHPALKGSLSFTIAVVSLDFILIALLLTIVFITRNSEMRHFNLENVIKALEA